MRVLKFNIGEEVFWANRFNTIESGVVVDVKLTNDEWGDRYFIKVRYLTIKLEVFTADELFCSKEEAIKSLLDKIYQTNIINNGGI